MTYAGYQRYETPNLGAVAVEQIDKQKAFDLKQQELDEARKYKQATLDAKAKEDADKVAAAKAKQEGENTKEVGTAQVELAKSTGKIPVTGLPKFNDALQQWGNGKKKRYESFLPLINNGNMTIGDLNTYKSQDIGSVEDVSSTVTALNETAKVATGPDASPSASFAFGEIVGLVNPTDNNTISISDNYDNGILKTVVHSYRKNEDGEEEYVSTTPLAAVKNAVNLANYKAQDPDKMISDLQKEIKVTPQYNLNKAGAGTKVIDQSTQDNYKKAIDMNIRQVQANPYVAADFYKKLYGSDPTKGVAFIKADATPEEKKKIADQAGLDVKDMDFVEFKYDEKENVLMPKLTKVQNERLANSIRDKWNVMAEKSTTPINPSTTTVNITSQEQAETLADRFVQGVRNNESAWVDEFKTQAMRAGMIVPLETYQGKPVVDYNPRTKVMVVYSNHGEVGKAPNWQPQTIDMKNPELAKTQIATLIKAANITSNTAATLPPIKR